MIVMVCAAESPRYMRWTLVEAVAVKAAYAGDAKGSRFTASAVAMSTASFLVSGPITSALSNPFVVSLLSGHRHKEIAAIRKTGNEEPRRSKELHYFNEVTTKRCPNGMLAFA